MYNYNQTNLQYFDIINHNLSGIDGFLCDKCYVQPLTEYEFNNCVRSGFRYCLECFNYIHLKRWFCGECGTSGTIRSQRADIFIKHCKKRVLWLK